MPTAAGPNTKGEENLVFGYDLGDTLNSYKGEPTINLWDSILNTQSMRTHTKHYWDGRKWIEDATYTHPGVNGPEGVYLGIVFKHISGAFNSTWSGNSYGYMLRDIACTSGATMTQSAWIYVSEDCNLDEVPSIIEQEAGGETSVTGYPSGYDLNNKGTWQVTARKATSDGQVRFIPLYPRKNGTTIGEFTGFLMWGLPQVTYGDHVVQPIQNGTSRSVTESLLDLAKNTSIDLSSVSFDLNAQMTFDGTDDYIDGPALNSISSEWTIEVVFKPSSITNYENIIDCNYAYNGTTGNIGPRLEINSSGNLVWIWSGDTSSNNNFYRCNAKVSGLTANAWHYAAISRTAANTPISFCDGEFITGPTSIAGTPSSPFVDEFTNLNIGRGFHLGGAERMFTGDIAYVKIYNRALTTSEIQVNYNAIKGRFNI